MCAGVITEGVAVDAEDFLCDGSADGVVGECESDGGMVGGWFELAVDAVEDGEVFVDFGGVGDVGESFVPDGEGVVVAILFGEGESEFAEGVAVGGVPGSELETACEVGGGDVVFVEGSEEHADVVEGGGVAGVFHESEAVAEGGVVVVEESIVGVEAVAFGGLAARSA